MLDSPLRYLENANIAICSICIYMEASEASDVRQNI